MRGVAVLARGHEAGWEARGEWHYVEGCVPKFVRPHEAGGQRRMVARVGRALTVVHGTLRRGGGAQRGGSGGRGVGWHGDGVGERRRGRRGGGRACALAEPCARSLSMPGVRCVLGCEAGRGGQCARGRAVPGSCW